MFDFGEGWGIDGMVMDVDGNIYVIVGFGWFVVIYVFLFSGEMLVKIVLLGNLINCCFGCGDELNKFYIIV